MNSNEQYATGGEPEAPSYYLSAGIASSVFGFFIFVVTLVSTYLTIHSEPSGSFFSSSQLVGILACLIGAFGGMLATWHYAREYDVKIDLGKGALIGFVTGVGIAVVSVLLNQVWQNIDPDMHQQWIESTIANVEAMNIPEQQKQQIIDSTAESMRSQQSIGSQIIWSIPSYGILNLLTGMIGAKIFGKDEDEFRSTDSTDF